MKLLIASDLHGSARFCSELVCRIDAEEPDRILLLGDLLYHGPRNALPEGYDPMAVAEMLNALKERIIAVRGNCDAEVDQMVLEFPCGGDYIELIDRGRTLFATHGHLFDADELPYLAPGSAFISGHTHVKLLEEQSGILLVNPGSISIPKDGSASYAVYKDGAFALKGLDGTTLAERALPPAR
ncbi:phosphodiesterase [Raoultibacter phocaeensis]|uniref:phosphodiesterase n=1 Tax=Raoultibacter phocaeensis TaxID=2479841 RepID=UPI00111B8E03|nr:phosphodiesterase [Raoultibacter phocaeensis]